MHQRSANEIVGENVASLRGDMSQAQLAKKLAEELGKERVDPTSITRLESGKRPTTVNELAALGRIFEVPPEALLLESPFASEIAAARADITRLERSIQALSAAAFQFRTHQRDLALTVDHLEKTGQLLSEADMKHARTLLRTRAETIVEQPPF